MKLHKDIIDKRAINNFTTLEKRCNQVHSNFYDYSKYIYSGLIKKSTIICPIHGGFSQNLKNHLHGQGCKLCGVQVRAKKRTKERSEVVKEANIIHNNKYDYSKLIYTKAANKVIIICNEHGEWEQTVNNHLNGMGCPKCALINRSKKLMKSKEHVLKIANKVHKNWYYYSEFEYKGMNNKSIIICKKHGKFNQIVWDHLSGKGCAKCARCGTDDDSLYIWNIKDTNVYKIGVTSHSLGDKRIKIVARKQNITPVVIAHIRVKNAHTIESKIHKTFKTKQDLITNGDGYTEFRTLSDMELVGILDYLKKEMISGEINYHLI